MLSQPPKAKNNFPSERSEREGEAPPPLAEEGATRAPTIETFPNPEPERNYLIHCDCPEFTCLCPKTGQPDFATIKICYIPDKKCVELKSLKNYLWSYRGEGAFHEKVTNQILNDLVYVVEPQWMEVRAMFNVRGGIATTVTATHGEKPV